MKFGRAAELGEPPCVDASVGSCAGTTFIYAFYRIALFLQSDESAHFLDNYLMRSLHIAELAFAVYPPHNFSGDTFDRSR